MAEIKIGDINTIASSARVLSSPERQTAETQSRSFRSELSSLNSSNYAQKLTEMSENITAQGQLLAKRMDINELKRYKAMISEFMNEMVRFTFEFNKKSTLDARGRHRAYSIIKRLNKKLEELTAKILADERDNIEIMKMIDDIRGMIIDLML